MVILRTRNKITDVLMILAWASPFKYIYSSRRLHSTMILKPIPLKKIAVDYKYPMTGKLYKRHSQ